MHSSMPPWDFFGKPNVLAEGLNSITLFDTYLWSFVHSQISESSVQKWKTVFASDLTVEELETDLSNLNLFNMDNFVLVHEAEKLSKKLQTWVLENAELFSGKTYVFIFQSKPAWRKKWNDKGNHLTIEAPKFWQQSETMKLLCQLMKIKMQPSASRIFMERVPFSWGEYVRGLEDLCENEQRTIDEACVTDFFQNQKLDKFHLANLIGNKRMRDFWDSLLGLDLSQDELRDVFVFIHSHLFKMINKEEIESKSKTNKYEKEILAAARKWSKKELLELLKKFNEWELRLKAQDSFLIPELRLFSV